MTTVRIAAGEQYDLAGTKEMNEHFARLDAKFAELTREQLRGLKLMKIPTLQTIAPSTAPISVPPASSGYGLAGPESGFVWRIGRITVVSSGADNASTGFAAVTTPAVPATTVAQQNNNAFPVKVVITGGTMTAVIVNGVTVGTGAGTYSVPSAGTISLTYTVAPTWAWSAFSATVNPGTGYSLYITSDESAQPRNLVDSALQCGQAYYPGTHGLHVMPGEGLLATISAPIAGNAYTLTGRAWSVPAEMMGKLA